MEHRWRRPSLIWFAIGMWAAAVVGAGRCWATAIFARIGGSGAVQTWEKDLPGEQQHRCCDGDGDQCADDA